MSKENYNERENHLEEEELFREMSHDLGRQISAELDENRTQDMASEEDDIYNTKILSEEDLFGKEGLTPTYDSYDDDEAYEEEPKKKKFNKKIIFGIAGGFIGLLAVIVIAGGVLAYNMLDSIVYKPDDQVIMEETDLTPEEYDNYLKELANSTPRPFTGVEDEVINILLIGQEAMKDSKGRSDSMLLASVNLKEKTYKLTSIMRDIYLKIPGYKDNKLNAAFNKGEGPLLSKTIEENFHIKIDGYVTVTFEGFERIIDKLGGVEVELTAAEAEYLNRKNYISKKKNRNVVEGVQVLNGNQALGYCRVRFKKASNGESDDFGRTYRQRVVLNSIFNKYMAVDVNKKISLAKELLSDIYTNIETNTLIEYITQAAMLGSTELQTFRIPVDGSYRGDKLYCGGNTRKKSSVLVVDFEKNIGELRQFLYGEPYEGSSYTRYYTGNESPNYNSSSSSGSNQYTPPANNNSTNNNTYVAPTPTKAPVKAANQAPTKAPAAEPTQEPSSIPSTESEAPEPEGAETTVPEEPEDPGVEPEEPETPVETSPPVKETQKPVENPTEAPAAPTQAPAAPEPTKAPVQAPTKEPDVTTDGETRVEQNFEEEENN